MAVASPARPRGNSSRLFIIAGAALALIAFVLVILLGGSRGGGGIGGGPSTQVVVAARDIPFRTPFAKEDLALQSFPAGAVPPGAFTKLSDVIGAAAATASPSANGITTTNSSGRAAAVPIKKGQPVLDNMTATSLDAIQIQPAYLQIPKGWVAATIPTGEQIGIAGYVQAGDYINVIATAQSTVFGTAGGSSGPPKSVTRTVFTNVHVLKVGPATNQVSAGGSPPQSQTTGGVSSSLTVILTQCDWEFLRWLQANAQLTYSMGSYQDYKPQDIKPDPACIDSTIAKGVGPQAVDQRWGFTKLQ